MTEETTSTEDLKDEARGATERISVAGSDLIKTVQALLREAAVRKITVQDKNGRTLIEFPLYAGIVGAFFVGSWTVLALIAAWFAEVSILIERDPQSDGGPSVVGEAVDRAAGGASESARSATESARSAAASAKSGLGAAISGAARGASDLARKAADSLEGRMGHEEMAQAEEAAEAIKAAAAEAAAEPRQCAALTKSGARCKRHAVAGSDFCSTHQPK
ncbi:MAG TPA: DUF4342 domain-containing protein [Promineifilum sp.]|nr:DUF4342 domain-containing protein [Promineifilum sp.]